MIEFTLPDMTCGHCVKSVTAVVHAVDAQAAVQIDLPAHKVRIESSQAAEAFGQALAAEGCEVWLNGRDRTKLEAAAAALRAKLTELTSAKTSPP